MKVYCVMEEDNFEASDDSFCSWENLKKIFDSEQKAKDWILTQDFQSMLHIKAVDVE